MDSYDSKYPLQYYEVGVPYQFYLSKFTVKKGFGKFASKDDVAKYSHYFDNEHYESLVNDYHATQKNNSPYVFGNLIRIVGIVIKTYRKCGMAFIDVMYKNINDGIEEYRLVSYQVEKSEGTLTDGKDDIPAQSSINVVVDSADNTNVTSGITTSVKEKIESGLTHKDHTKSTIGRLTRSNQATEEVSGLTASSRVSGLTRTEVVSGITVSK